MARRLCWSSSRIRGRDRHLAVEADHLPMTERTLDGRGPPSHAVEEMGQGGLVGLDARRVQGKPLRRPPGVLADHDPTACADLGRIVGLVGGRLLQDPGHVQACLMRERPRPHDRLPRR